MRLLGLARRAGAVATGLDASRRAIREGGVKLLLTAADASPAQLDKIVGLADHRGIPRCSVADRGRLGAAVGAPPASAVAVMSEGFAEQLLRRLSGPGEDREPSG